jgi:hypothetical protein
MTGLRFWKEELNLIERKLPSDPLEVIHCFGGSEPFLLGADSIFFSNDRFWPFSACRDGARERPRVV